MQVAIVMIVEGLSVKFTIAVNANVSQGEYVLTVISAIARVLPMLLFRVRLLLAKLIVPVFSCRICYFL